MRVFRKFLFSLGTVALLGTQLFGQATEKLSYQAVMRNSSNVLLASKKIGMKISILQGSVTGAAVYIEIQTPMTNLNGIISLEIGSGTIISGTIGGINWSKGPFFIKTEADPLGGSNYTITGTTQLLSVSYTMYARNGIKPGAKVGEMNYWNGTAWVPVSPGLDGQILTILNGVPTWVVY